MTYSAKVIAGGKIVIPAELRREFGIKDGDTVVLERHSAGGFTLKTYDQVLKEVQAEFRRHVKRRRGNVVDELLAERREEARQELEEFDRTDAIQRR